MKVAGLSSRIFSEPIRPSCSQPWNFFWTDPKLWTSAMVSTAMKPTLCRCRAYCPPGLPRPTQSCTSIPPNGKPAQGKAGQRKTGPHRCGPALLASTAQGSGARFGLAVVAFFAAQARGGNDGGDGEVAVGDRRGRPFRQGHVADVDRGADFEAGDVDPDLVGDRIRRADQFELVTDDVEHAAALQARRGFL